MKYLYPIILVLLMLSTGFINTISAQSPLKLSYQAVMRDASNELLVNRSVKVKVSILKGSAGGTLVYAETHTVTTNANGLVTLQIGGGNVLSGSMGSINWALGPYFVKTDTDPNGGSNYSITASSELLSVPYALYSANGGTPGPQGPAGPTGPTGPAGPTGATGAVGPTGPTGDQGPIGPAGPVGPKGDKGDQGVKGDVGDVGDEGPKGDTGEKGDKGDKGDKGLKGDTGAKGDKGDQGIQGLTGPQGPAGPQGPPGPIAGSNMQINFNDNGIGGGDQDLLFDKVSNHMTIGASGINPSAALEIKSTSGGLLLPRLTTQQRDAISAPEGLMIYNMETGKFQGFASNTAVTFAASEVAAATYVLSDDGADAFYLAQSFTPTTSGQLQRIEFNVNTYSPGFEVRIELYQGNPTGSGGTFIDAQEASITTAGWYKLHFPSNPSLASGVEYYFIIKPANVSNDVMGIFTSDSGSPGQHAGGSMYIWNDGSGDFDISSGNDIDFRVISVPGSPGWVNLH